jgi:hypothetical protein
MCHRVGRYSIQHPREFLLTNQLAQIPFIQERARSEKAPALVVAFNQVMIDAQQQHLLKAMPLNVMSVLLLGTTNALVEAHMRQQIHLDQATIEQATAACWDAIKRSFFLPGIWNECSLQLRIDTGKEILLQSLQYHCYGGPEERIAVDRQKNVQQI